MTEDAELRDEAPHVGAYCKDGTVWLIAFGEYAGLHDAWSCGRAFWSGVDVYGQELDVKLADVVGIVRRTRESIALRQSEDAERRRRKMVHGEDG